MKRLAITESLEARCLLSVTQLTSFNAPYSDPYYFNAVGTTENAALVNLTLSGQAPRGLYAVRTDGVVTSFDVGSSIIASLRGPDATAVLLCDNGVWQTDGTQAGTRRVFSGVPLTDANARGKIAVDVPNAAAYFFAYTGNAYALWRADLNTGQSISLGQVGGLTSRTDNLPMHAMVVNGTFYFSTTVAGGSFRQLWRYSAISGIQTIPLSGSAAQYSMRSDGPGPMIMGDTIVFSAYSTATGWEPVLYDHGSANVRYLADLVPGSGSSMGNNEGFIDTTPTAATFTTFVGTVRQSYVTDGEHVSVIRSAAGDHVGPPYMEEAAGGRALIGNMELDPATGLLTPFFEDADVRFRALAVIDDTRTLISAVPPDGSGTSTQLYVTDGTLAGTKLLLGGPAAANLSVAGVSPTGVVYLQRNRFNPTSEIVATDGTVARVLDAKGSFVGTFADGSAITLKATIEAGYQVYRLALDAVPPTLLSSDVDPDTSAGLTVTFNFSEPLAPSLTSSSFEVVDVATNLPATGASPALSTTINTDGTASVRLTFPPSWPDGDYRIVLQRAAATDVEGNPLASEATASFFLLAGDANRDRIVNFGDLVILARNYNQSGKTFSEGNFDYSSDGNVTFADLVLLARQYNKKLAAIAVPAALSALPDATRATKRTSRVARPLSELA